MSKQIHCDRCRKHMVSINEWPGEPIPEIVVGVIVVNRGERETLDLCRDCFDKLKKFMKEIM